MGTAHWCCSVGSVLNKQFMYASVFLYPSPQAKPCQKSTSSPTSWVFESLQQSAKRQQSSYKGTGHHIASMHRHACIATSLRSAVCLHSRTRKLALRRANRMQQTADSTTWMLPSPSVSWRRQSNRGLPLLMGSGSRGEDARMSTRVVRKGVRKDVRGL